MPNRRSHDPIGNYNFRVEIEGVTQGAFKSVDGLDSRTEIIEYQDGDDTTLRKRPGRTRYSNVILRRGFVNSDEFWKWRKAVVDGKVERKSGSIILLDDSGGEVMRYNFYEGWPCVWKGFELDGQGTDATVEEVQIAVEKIERA